MTAFVDEVVIEVRAGNGGDGLVSLHREKFRPKGGPDGGDGGDGAQVVLRADARMSSLIDFQFESVFSAQHGLPGRTNRGHGPSGRDLVVKVPVGCTVTRVDTGELYGELFVPGQELVVAVGGSAGRGNAAFATSTRQTPRFAERGLRGERARLRLELKLLADIGLVGLPNAGKSSLLRIVSAARPKVADYPFTTLQPELGVYRAGEGESYVIADVPGLIEGAHRGVGLGDAFLRHLERTRVLVHLLDVSFVEREEPVADYETIRAELEAYGRGLTDLPVLVGLNKMDIADPELVEMVEGELAQIGCLETFRISAATGDGVDRLIGAAVSIVQRMRRDAPPPADPPKRTRRPDPPVRPIMVEGPVETVDDDSGEVSGRLFTVSGTEVERVIARTHLANPEALLYLHQQLVALGVLGGLEDLGAREGDTVRIGDAELEYVDAASVRD